MVPFKGFNSSMQWNAFQWMLFHLIFHLFQKKIQTTMNIEPQIWFLRRKEREPEIQSSVSFLRSLYLLLILWLSWPLHELNFYSQKNEMKEQMIAVSAAVLFLSVIFPLSPSWPQSIYETIWTNLLTLKTCLGKSVACLNCPLAQLTEGPEAVTLESLWRCH